MCLAKEEVEKEITFTASTTEVESQEEGVVHFVIDSGATNH